MIALDIDGTITPNFLEISQEVISYLESLSKEGWKIYLLTGRSFSFANHAIKAFPFTYNIAVLNGAMILEMPSCKILKKHYLSGDLIPKFDSICENEPTDLVIFSGYERGDVCYYRPQYYSPDMLKYIQERAKAFNEDWQPVDDFNHLDLPEFASVKCIGHHDVVSRIVKKMIETFDIYMPIITDPHNEDYFVGLGTQLNVNKGEAIKDLKIIHPLIVAGDDYNDLPMLKLGDIKIVMETAPKEILELADIVAKPATQNGIIPALQKALKTLRCP